MGKLIRGALVAAALLGATAAFAGYKYGYPTVVNATSRYAAGTMGGARASANTVEYIICNVTAYTGGTYAQCYAKDAAGAFGSCYTTDPKFISVISTIQGDSYIYFNWDASGYCSQVSMYQGSYTDPKMP